ncbi:MAG: hypothetical protein M0R30_12680 [Methanoregula sp.]|jgi:hypothetical protein|uniref:hypothetical protein n=1 Tax=Methanoregula sp. TaxID=2052170 RepID=UPI0025DC86DA|nr:hypothetical protein [Methanoregula sp.]MCK9632479.1 hypothetical protein [Methanoregula sp.]
MDYQRILVGREKPIPIYKGIVAALENPLAFPDLLEPIYREAMTLDDQTLDQFRFSLMRLQLYADIHRNENLEQMMHIKYVAQVLEKVVFGSLIMEPTEPTAE